MKSVTLPSFWSSYGNLEERVRQVRFDSCSCRLFRYHWVWSYSTEESQMSDEVIRLINAFTTLDAEERYAIIVELASDVRCLKKVAFDAQCIGTYPAVKLTRNLGDLPTDQLDVVEQSVRVWLSLP